MGMGGVCKYCMNVGYRPAYDQSRSEYPHNTRQHRAVIDPQPGYWRDCSDRDTGVARENELDWSTILYVDFKIGPESFDCERQWQDLYTWMAIPSEYKILHWVNDGLVRADHPEIIGRLSTLPVEGEFYLDLVSRVYPQDNAEMIRARLLAATPSRTLLQGLDYRTVDRTSAWCSHDQIVHPHGMRRIHYQYD